MMLVPRANEGAHKLIALIASLAAAGMGVAVFADFDYGRTESLQFVVNHPWIDVISSRYALGLDGLSLPLLALTLLMAAVLLVVVMVNGLGVFWPSRVAVATLKDGSVVMGEIIRKDPMPSGEGERLQFKIGNRDLYGLDFRWIDGANIERIEYPETTVVVERQEYGNFYGTLKGVESPDPSLPADPWERLEAAREIVEKQMSETEEISAELTDINPVLKIRKAWEVRAGPGSKLLNLALRGLEAMPDGGRLRIGAVVRGGRVVITVEDTGPGLPPALLDELYQVHFTGGKSASGIGLYMARLVVESHGGEIVDEGGPGEGHQDLSRLPHAGHRDLGIASAGPGLHHLSHA